jgi:hypothetical protein
MDIKKISIKREVGEHNPFNFYIGREIDTGRIVALGESFLEVIESYTNAINKAKK